MAGVSTSTFLCNGFNSLMKGSNPTGLETFVTKEHFHLRRLSFNNGYCPLSIRKHKALERSTHLSDLIGICQKAVNKAHPYLNTIILSLLFVSLRSASDSEHNVKLHQQRKSVWRIYLHFFCGAQASSEIPCGFKHRFIDHRFHRKYSDLNCASKGISHTSAIENFVSLSRSHWPMCWRCRTTDHLNPFHCCCKRRKGLVWPHLGYKFSSRCCTVWRLSTNFDCCKRG